MKAGLLHDFLGWVAENNSEMFFSLAKVETAGLKKRLTGIKIDRPIYVCGLARSGTTILLELLSKIEGVASYRYMDFPFVMLPFWWGRFLKTAAKKEYDYVERVHADGLKVTPRSPEAMEEILWSYFFARAHDPNVSNVLDTSDRLADFDEFYKETIKKFLLQRGAVRYLAKNNYNISRMEYLIDIFPDAKIIVPVRDPATHIASLIKTHNLFSAKQKEDKRMLAYMRRAKHFEFGLDRRLINFGSKENIEEIEALWEEGKDIEAWAKYCSTVSLFLKEVLASNEALKKAVLVVNYEHLCDKPVSVLEKIYSHIGIAPNPSVLADQASCLVPTKGMCL